MRTPKLQPMRCCLVAGLLVGFSSAVYSADKTAEVAVNVPAAAATDNESVDRPAVKAKLEKAQDEAREMRRALRAEKQTAGQGKQASDLAIADRAVKIEKLLTKQREVAALRRQSEDPAARAERHALQDRLAAAKTREERQAILDHQTALQRALSEESATQTATR